MTGDVDAGAGCDENIMAAPDGRPNRTEGNTKRWHFRTPWIIIVCLNAFLTKSLYV